MRTVGRALPSDKAIDAARRLLELLLSHLGAWGTIGLVAMVLLALLGWRHYNNIRADRAMRMVLDEKERTIQRLANQERTWRKLFLTAGIKLTPHEADMLLLLEGDYRNAREAREAVESRRR